MNRVIYRRQAVDMLGWIFGWYKNNKGGHYVVPDGFQIHHIDGDYTNNSLDNLVILTVEEHMKIHEKDRAINGKNGGKISGKKTGGRNKKSILCVETGIVYKSIMEAERQTGISNPSIVKACRGKYKTAGGYHWEYVSDDG